MSNRKINRFGFLASFVCLITLLTMGCKSDGVAPNDGPPIDNTIATFPNARWEKIAKPEDAGFSSDKLDLIAHEAIKHQTAAFLVIYKGKILYERGNIEHKYQSHSLRKSVLSALYGKYVKNGDIDLNSTMADLLIDDNEGLSATEKQATVRDLLQARSGIYHPAHYETESMQERKPDRYSHDPGTFWYYNNWDFNALGTIFEQQTGKSVLEAIEDDFAGPLQMDFKASRDRLNGRTFGINSRHEAYPFRISAVDLARFGLLMLNKGKWKNQQVFPADWVAESTRYHSDAAGSNSSGYGYLWWVNKTGNQYKLMSNADLPAGAYLANGVGAQIVLVIPEYDMVIVHRVDTDKDHSVTLGNIGKMVQLVLNARS